MDGVSSGLCGVLCINKPQGFTSFDVIGKLRGMLRMRRLGHAGTLDPMATGVLPVFVGAATKACDILPDHDKRYTAGFALGITTDTEDISGSVTSKSDAPVPAQTLESALSGFRGDIMQIPPMYSAVSVNGKRLYEYARQGKEIEREPRQISVYSLELLRYDESAKQGELDISCSKGTYVRTLISDIGKAVGSGGVMTSLRRTTACGFTLADCVTFEELEEIIGRNELEGHVLPVERLFESFDRIDLDEKRTVLYRNGVKLSGLTDTEGVYRVYAHDGEFIGLCEYDAAEKVIRVKKNFR